MSSNTRRSHVLVVALALLLATTAMAPSCGPTATRVDLPGLLGPVKVYTDTQGTPHIVAESRIDLFRAWGYVMARDRFFQMDLLRRVAAGRAAELIGIVALLGIDPELRPMGLYRAAALGPDLGRTLLFEDLAREQPLLPVPAHPEVLVSATPTPRVGPTEAGSGLAARAATRLAAAGLGFAEHVPDGSNAWAVASRHTETAGPIVAGDNHDETRVPNTRYEVHVAIEGGTEPPLNLAGIGVVGAPAVLHGHNGHVAWGSTASGADDTDVFEDRLVRSSPDCPVRLCIVSDGVHHPVVERAETYLANSGGALFDATALVANPLAKTALEVPFRSFGAVVEIDDPSLLGAGGFAETRVLTMQWTGSHGTDESGPLSGIWASRDVHEFREAALGWTGKQNWIAADAVGNVAYVLTGELPLRADLEAGYVHGPEPRLVRDGSGPTNWLPDPERTAGQSIPYRVIPRDELTHAINPFPGYVISANHDSGGESYDNDPLNQFRPSTPGAILYFGAADYDNGFRAARIQALLDAAIAAEDPISMQDVVDMQGNNQGMDVELFRPFLLAALTNAERAGAPPELAALAQDSEIQEALARIAAWDLTTPTGIPEGWDYGQPPAPDPVVPVAEAEASVAATIYEVWRDRFNKATVKAVLDTLGTTWLWGNWNMTLLHILLSQDPFTGIGASGLDFFPGPAHLAPEDRRDLVLLQAVRSAFDDLAGARFADEYGRSTIQDDYRYGRLHRLTLPHPLGHPENVPPAAGFADLGQRLPGLPVGGGRFTVNPGHSNFPDFSPTFIASNRIVMSFDADGTPIVWNQMAGPATGDTTDPLYHEGLERWLTGTPHRLEMRIPVVAQEAVRRELFRAPAP